jgi:hypothetical protein
MSFTFFFGRYYILLYIESIPITPARPALTIGTLNVRKYSCIAAKRKAKKVNDIDSSKSYSQLEQYDMSASHDDDASPSHRHRVLKASIKQRFSIID